MEQHPSETRALEEILSRSSGPLTVGKDGRPFLILREGQHLADLSDYLPTPTHRKASVTVQTVESFIAYIAAFRTPDTQLFGNAAQSCVVAILDYHEAGATGQPNWGDHRVTLSLKPSPQWQTWLGSNGKALSQTSFAEFLEDNLADIVEPDAAQVLEVAMHLEAKKTVSFKSGVNLKNGAAQLSYDENIEGKGKGSLTIPTAFTLGIPLFLRGAPCAVNARLRYRIQDDKLTFAYKIERPEQLIETAFDTVLQKIEEATGLKPYLGTAG